jgi:hypothetical protein
MEEAKQHLVRRDVEWKQADDQKMVKLIESMPYPEQGLFCSPFLVEASGMGYMPEDTLRLFQDTIMKYYALLKEQEES